MGRISGEQIAEMRRATDRAKAVLRPGDRVSRTMCLGIKGTFKFIGWDGMWACGKTIYDCAATNIYAVNGEPVSFRDPAP